MGGGELWFMGGTETVEEGFEEERTMSRYRRDPKGYVISKNEDTFCCLFFGSAILVIVVIAAVWAFLFLPFSILLGH